MPPFQRGFQGVASRWEPAVTGSVNDVVRELVAGSRVSKR